MTPKSSKAKGRTLQNYVAENLRNLYGGSPDDIRPAIMGESGADIKLSSSMRERFGYSVECKNQERIAIWGALLQAEINAKRDGTTPALVFHRNHSRKWVAIPFENWMDLLVEAKR